MSYEIESKSDFATGTAHIVRISEDMVDWKALYTMQHSLPEFVVPFCVRHVDGALELSYPSGEYTRLQYLAARRPVREYAELWRNLLMPLFDCADWFMQPFSFVMDFEYLFMDMKTQRIRYLYIPSVKPCASFEDMRQMMMEVSRQNPCMDSTVESMVQRKLSGAFQPKEFLQMVKDQSQEMVPAAQAEPQRFRAEPPVKPSPVQSSPVQQPARHTAASRPVGTGGGGKPNRADMDDKDEIIIELFDGPHLGDLEEEPQQKHGFFGSGKKKKKEKKGSRLFSRKKTGQEDDSLMMQDDLPETPPARRPRKPARPDSRQGGNSLGTPAQRAQPVQRAAQPVQTAPPRPPIQPRPQQPVQPAARADRWNNFTQVIEPTAEGTGFYLLGDTALPRVIPVRLNEGETFRIGRFDVTVGVRQSDFEFDKKTREVSRRHAVVERTGSGYTLIDLVSKAGTYLDGEPLVPNIPYPLHAGSRVSFGRAGADYIWQE